MTTNISLYPFESSRKIWYFADYPEEESESSWINKLQKLLIRLFGDTNAEYYRSYCQNPYVEGYSVESESLTYSIEQSLHTIFDLLHIDIAHPAEVFDYILQSPGLDLIVMYACILTENEFRCDSTITLDIYQDPESDDRYLTIYVRQNEYDTNIIKRMDKICDEYEPTLNDQSGWLLLTTDFKSPAI